MIYTSWQTFSTKTMSTENNSRNKLWEFVHTNFGIWLLSSAIVGLLTFSYTKLSESISNSNKQKKQIIKLDIEIEGFAEGFSLSGQGIANLAGDTPLAVAAGSPISSQAFSTTPQSIGYLQK